MNDAVPQLQLWCWRHPRCAAAAGRCIGHTDVALSPRRAKRLAHRIRAHARQHGLPRVVWVSPLQRSRAVGQWLQRWGWAVHVSPLLRELHFGHWDGLPWVLVPWAEVEAWQNDLLHHAPGGGESLADMQQRVQAFLRGLGAAAKPVQLVGHGGWINTLLHALDLPTLPDGRTHLPVSAWPPAPPHGSLRQWQGSLP
jgi:alpha-ribazole phosphatase